MYNLDWPVQISFFELPNWPFVNLGFGTSALELELELEIILQTPLFPVA